ncbi:MAG: hypothetical protein ACOZBZ_04270 [Patescibacteria group bacterium]
MTEEKKFLKRPEKKETLAGKQEERLRRLNHLRKRLPELPPQWWVGAGEIVGLGALSALQLYLLLPFFGKPDTANVFSAPVIPVLASVTNALVPYSFGVRIWLLVFLIFFPVSFYFFVREISGRKLTGFLSSLLVSLSIGIFLPLRVSLGLLAEDGAHIASLTFIPLVCLLLLRFLRSGNFWAGILTALGTTLVALSSPIGFFILTTFMVIITFSEMLQGRGRLKAARFLIVLVLAAGFSAFWYNPKFVILTIKSPQGQLIKKTLSTLLPISFFLFPLLGVFGFLLFENRPQLQPMFIAFFQTLTFGLFSLGAGVAHPSPSRFLPAFGISLAFLLGISITGLFDFLRLSDWLARFKISTSRRNLVAFSLLGLVLVTLTLIIFLFAPSLWSLEETQVLGALSPDKTVGMWEIKEKTNQIESLVGYMISGVSALSVLILRLKLP